MAKSRLERYRNALTLNQRAALDGARVDARTKGQSVTIREHDRRAPLPLTGRARRYAAIEALESASMRVVSTLETEGEYTQPEQKAIRRALDLIVETTGIEPSKELSTA